jgi:hypothetical protein
MVSKMKRCPPAQVPTPSVVHRAATGGARHHCPPAHCQHLLFTTRKCASNTAATFCLPGRWGEKLKIFSISNRSRFVIAQIGTNLRFSCTVIWAKARRPSALDQAQASDFVRWRTGNIFALKIDCTLARAQQPLILFSVLLACTVAPISVTISPSLTVIETPLSA